MGVKRWGRQTPITPATGGTLICKADPTRVYLGIYGTNALAALTISMNQGDAVSNCICLNVSNSATPAFQLYRQYSPWLVTQAWFLVASGLSMGATVVVLEEFEMNAPDDATVGDTSQSPDQAAFITGDLALPDPVADPTGYLQRFIQSCKGSQQ